MPMTMVSGVWGNPMGPLIPFQVCLVPSETPGSPLYYGWREKSNARLALSWRLGLIDPPTPGRWQAALINTIPWVYSPPLGLFPPLFWAGLAPKVPRKFWVFEA